VPRAADVPHAPHLSAVRWGGEDYSRTAQAPRQHAARVQSQAPAPGLIRCGVRCQARKAHSARRLSRPTTSDGYYKLISHLTHVLGRSARCRGDSGGRVRRAR
jgi:hypothetical protein